MYNYHEIKSVHLEVTSKCQAKCPMCPRRLQGGPLIDGIQLEEITLLMFKKWFDTDFIKRLDHLYMCGNLGDPIVAKDTLEIFEYIRNLNPSMSLQMHTNGSGRSNEWWKRLAELNVKVVFGIDGLEDTHELYRISTDWNKILQNAKIFIDHGGNARWDMLVFKHNEHQIDDCKLLSQELGFSDFTIKHTTRFKNGSLEVIDENYNLQYVLLPSNKSIEMIHPAQKAKNERLPTINCKAQNDKSIYVSANGNISPCCWLDLEWVPQHSDSRIDYMIKIQKFPNLHAYGLKEIFESSFFKDIENSWTTCGMKECSKQCGSFDKLNEQFK